MNCSMLLTRKEGRTALTLFVLFCLFNAYQLTHLSVSIDNEFVYKSFACTQASLGRWLDTLLGVTLWPQPVVPTGPLLIFGALFAVSFIYVLRLFQVERINGWVLAVFAAYALYPTWLAQLAFATNVVPTGIGVFCVTWAALRTAANQAGWRSHAFWGSALPSAAACAVALGAYQSLGLMYLVLVLGAGLAMQQRAEAVSLMRLMLVAIGTLAIGAVAWSVVAKLVMVSCGVEPAAYAHQFWRPEVWLQQPWQPLRVVLGDWKVVYFRAWAHVGIAGAMFFTVMVACLYVCVRLAPKGQRARRAFWLLVMTGLPCLLGLMTGSPLPLRTFFGAAAVLCCLLFLAHSACGTLSHRSVITMLAVLMAAQGLYVNSVAQARGWAVAHHDQALAAAIYGELVRQNSGGGTTQHPIWVYFSGIQPFGADNAQGCAFLDRYYPVEPSTTTGASFFEWDGGNTNRIVNYMNLLGYTDLQAFEPQPPQTGRLAAMPAWPALGSVVRFGDGFLVKLSPPIKPLIRCGI